ncbi:MAG: hypothetical protein AAF465_12615 [Pseudomonadota bacterium]
MAMTSYGQSLALVLTGFLLGVIVAGARAPTVDVESKSIARYPHHTLLAHTPVWDILLDDRHPESGIALAQAGVIRIRVIDDVSSLHVMTYKFDDAVWQGRLLDVGNDGSVEVADITNGHCEAF